MNYFFVGIDVSKDTIDAAIWDSITQNSSSLPQPFTNDLKGLDQLIKTIKKMANKTAVWFCFEHTGAYHLLLEQQLFNHKLCYSVVPALEIKRSLGITRGKNDSIDAMRIAQYAATNQYKLKASKPQSPKLKIISTLLSARNLLVRNNTSYKNRLKNLIKTNQCVPVQGCIDTIEKLIKTLSKEIRQIEKEIKEIINSCDELKKTYNQITSIPGIGHLTASTTIAISDNFKSFDDARKFSSYCGVAPFEHKSGTSIRGKTRTSKLRNKEMKRLLFTAALSALRTDAQLASYYKRKINEGKHKLSVRNAIASKLVARMFAVIKRDQPYLKFSQ